MKFPGLLFDIGGTSTRVSITYDGERIENYLEYPTPQNYEDGINALWDYVSKLNLPELGVVSGGIAGPLHHDRSGIVNAPNLPGWNGKTLKADLQNKLGAEVFLENDTALVGLGESVYGEGKDHSIVAYVTVSTGVNGVRVVNKKIDPSYQGYEIGKQIVDFDESYMKGNFEDLISGASLTRRYRKLPSEIHDHVVWDEEARLLSYGLNNVAVFWSPEVIIVGGSVSKKIDLNKVTQYLENTLTIFPTVPRVLKATLEDRGGLMGAMQILRERN